MLETIIASVTRKPDALWPIATHQAPPLVWPRTPDQGSLLFCLEIDISPK